MRCTISPTRAAHEAARARRRARRHVHDHEPGPVRHVHDAADHQPAAGRDPVDRRHQEAAGGGHRPRRRRHDRDPPHRAARAHVGPPRVRRRVRGRVPPARCATCSSSATGKTSSTDAAGALARSGARTGRPTSSSARCTSARPTTTCCSSSTRTSTRSAPPPIPRTCSCRRRRVGAELVHADRGGDVTYHGPGQLVGYPIVTLPEWRDGLRDVVAYVRALEDVAHRRARRLRHRRRTASRGYTGVWVGDEKIAAIGVKVARGRTRHGFALNVDPDLGDVRPHRAVWHPRPRRHVDGRACSATRPEMRAVVDAVVAQFAARVRRRRASSARTSCGASTPTTSAPFTRGDGRRRRGTSRCGLLGRLAEAGVRRRSTSPRRAARSGCGCKADLGRRTSARRSG